MAQLYTLPTTRFAGRFIIELDPLIDFTGVSGVQHGGDGSAWLDYGWLTHAGKTENRIISYEIADGADMPVRTLRAILHMGTAAGSISPGAISSPFNLLSGAYSPAIFGGRRVIVQDPIGSPASTNPADWTPRFWGYLDDPGASSSGDLQIFARDALARLMVPYAGPPAWIGTEGQAVPLDEAIQRVFDVAFGVGAWVLKSPVTDIEWAIPAFEMGQVDDVLGFAREMAQQRGMVIRWWPDSVTGRFQATLMVLQEAKALPEFIYPASQTEEIPNHGSDLATYRNDFTLRYVDGATGDLVTIHRPVTAAEKAAFGVRPLEITEASTSHIDTAAEATAMLDSVEGALRVPAVVSSRAIPREPRIEVNSLLQFLPDGRVSQEAVDLYVVNWTERVSSRGDKFEESTRVDLRGAPVGQIGQWLRSIEGRPLPDKVPADYAISDVVWEHGAVNSRLHWKVGPKITESWFAFAIIEAPETPKDWTAVAAAVDLVEPDEIPVTVPTPQETAGVTHLFIGWIEARYPDPATNDMLVGDIERVFVQPRTFIPDYDPDTGEWTPRVADLAMEVARSLQRIGVVSELPISNTEYDLVLLTTDRKLYRWTGTGWTRATDGADIIADSILAGTLSAGAISSPAMFVPGVVTVEAAAPVLDAARSYADGIAVTSGGNAVFRQDEPPTERAPGVPLKEGDWWLDTNDGNRPHTWSVSLNMWVRAYTIIDGGDVKTGRVGAQYLEINGSALFAPGFHPSDILGSANDYTDAAVAGTGSGTGNVIIRSGTAPTSRPGAVPLVGGDIWIDTANGDLPYSWSTAGVGSWVRMYTKIDGGDILTGTVRASSFSTETTFGGALNSDPATSDIGAWEALIGTAVSTVQSTGTGGQVGNTALVSPEGAQSWMFDRARIPIDPTKTYRASAWARSAAANGTFYLALNLLDSAGVRIPGAGTFWLYPGAAGVTLGTPWQQFGGNFGAGTPYTFPSNARTMQIGVLMNFGGSSGSMRAQGVRLQEVIPGVLIRDGAITAPKINVTELSAITANIGTASAGIINNTNINPTRGIRLDLARTKPPTWTDWFDLAAIGSEPVIKVGGLTIRADGDTNVLDPRDKPLRIPFFQFQPATDTTKHKYTDDYLTIGASNTASVFYAPVMLPDGVTITRISARIYRETNAGGEVVDVALVRTDGSTSSNLRTVTFSGAGTGWQTFNSSTLSELVQAGDLGLYAYGIRVNMTTSWDDPNSVRLMHVEVRYTSPGYRYTL